MIERQLFNSYQFIIVYNNIIMRIYHLYIIKYYTIRDLILDFEK